MRISQKLNLISSVLTLLLVIYLITRNLNTGCFNWADYSVGFGTLFANLVVSILSAIGR